MQRGPREALERSVAALDRAKRGNAIVCVVLGVLFAGFAAVCAFGVGVVGVRGGGGSELAGVAAFGLFWFALALLLLVIGSRGLAKLRKKQRLMTSGVRGSARVLRYDESRLRVDGASVYTFDLEVELPNRAPYAVRLTEPVPRRGAVHDGALLTVFADPHQPSDIVIDWWS
ncbi:MAG: hypothetical protein U0263_30930 [Polyangiaceae bacterium]